MHLKEVLLRTLLYFFVLQGREDNRGMSQQQTGRDFAHPISGQILITEHVLSPIGSCAAGLRISQYRESECTRLTDFFHIFLVCYATVAPLNISVTIQFPKRKCTTS